MKNEILKNKNISSCTVASYSLLKNKMNYETDKKANKLCCGVQSVIFCLFPYYKDNSEGNISKYARGIDYHKVVFDSLNVCCEKFKKEYGKNFVALCDNSPLPEVYGAFVSGCGILGENGLIFDREYGSYVFIGTILTDMYIAPSYNPQRCCACNLCKTACPKENDCLSHLTQSNVDLSGYEKSLIENGLVWGCDICSDVCPMNKNPKISPNNLFTKNTINSLSIEDVVNLTRKEFTLKYKDRAFTWKGTKPIIRNLEIKNNV